MYLVYTDVYDTHAWKYHSILQSASEPDIFIYKCCTCKYFLELSQYPYPDVQNFTGHTGSNHGEGSTIIKSCKDAIMLKALK